MSGQKFEYVVVQHYNIVDFERKVTNFLNSGFVPVGGVHVLLHEAERYSQAMMRGPEAKVKITGPEETDIDVERIEKAFREHGFIKDAG